MWGIYLDSRAFKDGLFQAVVQYKIDNGKALAMLPKANYLRTMWSVGRI